MKAASDHLVPAALGAPDHGGAIASEVEEVGEPILVESTLEGRRVTTDARARSTWLLWALVVALVVAVVLTSYGEHRDPIALTVLMASIVIAYATVGALLVARDAGNRIGWLVLAAGIILALAGAADTYVAYGERTRPGSLPATWFAALLSNLAWAPLFMVLILVVLYFPTGRVAGPRWRFLPPVMLTLFSLVVAGIVLAPGRIEAGPDIQVVNPLGVEAVAPATSLAQAIGFVGLLPALAAAIVSLVLRFRRSHGDERQQIRWLMAVSVAVALLILLALVEAIVPGASVAGDALFYALVMLVGLGLPVSLGVAILKYRLYDLDLVVKKTVLYATVAVLLTTLFVSVALVVGNVAGRTQTGAVVAAAAIGVAFWPSVGLARRVADRVVYGGRATPYEVLTDFSTRVGGSYASEDVLDRMAGILAAGIGARSATVWLRVGDELVPAAAVPAADPKPVRVPVTDDEHPVLPADATADVRDDGELLGALAVTMPANDPLTPAKERLVGDLASQARLVLRNVRLIQELRASRQRLVTAQDEERRRLERNIHDGAQQMLVALGVKLGLLERIAHRDPDKAAELAAQLRADAAQALEDLRDLARGIFPPLLADEGLAAALRTVAGRSPVPVSVATDGLGRFTPQVESAVYFCCLEALQNVAKYANARAVRVILAVEGDALSFRVDDDGVGFGSGSVRHGSGLRGMADRLEALGGTLQVVSTPGVGTSVRGRVPVSVPRSD